MCAKCSVCPASWKSARQSSAPPIGWMTSIDAARHLDRRAERARRLLRPLLDVELDVLLRAQVDPEVGERRLERRQHRVGREAPSPTRGARKRRATSQRSRLVEPDAEPRAEEPVGARPRTAARSSRGSSRHWSARLVEVGSRSARRGPGSSARRARARASRPIARRLEVDRVQVLVGERRCAARSSRSRRPRSGSFAIDGAEHPVGDLLAVDARLELGLELGDALGVLAGQVAEVALAGEAPELAVAAAPSRRPSDCAVSSARQIGVALVDRLELERLLEAGEVEVVLLVELGDEAVGLARGRRRAHGGAASGGTVRRIRRVRELNVKTRAEDAAGRHHRAGARGARRRERRVGRARLRPAHDGRRDDQRARRPGGRARLRGRARADRRGRLGLAAHRGGRGRTRRRTSARR